METFNKNKLSSNYQLDKENIYMDIFKEKRKTKIEQGESIFFISYTP